MRPLALLVVVLAVVVAGCGDDESTFLTTTIPPSGGESTSATTAPPTTPPPESTSTPSTSAGESTTTAATTTTEASTTTAATTTTASTTSTTAAGHLFEVDTSDFFPDPFPTSTNHAHGSGCVTPDFTALPDGVWFGMAEGLGGGAITFDLACFFTGPTACAEATADGEECLDFYIRNKVATTFNVPVAPAARVWYIDALSADVSIPTEIALAAWPHPNSYQDCPGDQCRVWLYVNGGEATAIVEQYLP